jgi:endogenous inhibitor of DNA gyrase (YacG/DUF329 family)
MIIEPGTKKVKFGNKTYFCPRGNGYYYTTGPSKMLHWAILEAHTGVEIPRSSVVHHKDGNQYNNDPSNLEITNHKDHGRHHRLNDKKYSRNCKSCGKSFETAQYNSRKWCSLACGSNSKYYSRERIIKTCPVCQKQMEKKKHYDNRPTCSISCGKRLAFQKKREANDSSEAGR